MQHLPPLSGLRPRRGCVQALEAGADKAACSGALDICFKRMAGAPALPPHSLTAYKAAMLVLEQVRPPTLPKSGLNQALIRL